MNYKFMIFIILLSTYALLAIETYEDAEDYNTNGWSIYDNNPSGATITNVYDQARKSQVIKLSGLDKNNGYLLRNKNGSWWSNSKDKLLQWSMKYSEDFKIYIRLKTTQGLRFLYYTPSENSKLGIKINYIHHGLGKDSKNGNWHTVTRNIEKDLKEAQPHNELISILGFYIRGSGSLDDIRTLSNNNKNPTPSPSRISPILYITATDSDGEYKCDGVSDQIEINQALDRVSSDANLTTVYLKGPMTCIIDEPILISSNTKLIGDLNVTVKLRDNIGWNTPNKPLIGQKNSDGTIAWEIGTQGRGTISNIEISGFELSGGIQSEPTGQYFVILINLYNPSYIKIHDMNLHDSRGDIIRLYGSNQGKEVKQIT